MSRSIKGSKHSGYEYWSKRPYSICKPGKISKKITSSMERMINNEIIIEELNLIANDSLEDKKQLDFLKKY